MWTWMAQTGSINFLATWFAKRRLGGDAHRCIFGVVWTLMSQCDEGLVSTISCVLISTCSRCASRGVQQTACLAQHDMVFFRDGADGVFKDDNPTRLFIYIHLCF